MSEVILKVKDLRKRYGDNEAVKGVSFEVKKGEIFGILGPNGAGKTTTLEMIETLRDIDGGSATIDGVDVAKHPYQIRGMIGVQPQTPGGAAPAFTELSCGVDGTIWLAGGHQVNGIWQLQATADGFALNERVTQALAHRAVVSLRQDRRGWLWAGTDDGVFVWNGVRSRYLDEDAGLVWNDCNQAALYEDDDGSIWIGTSRGASHVERPEVLFDVPRLRARIESVRRDAQTLRLTNGASLPFNASFTSATAFSTR